ncbi:response regulator [Paracraurococcus lichenis]|uniref:histidine kinase n=1 Tax=Paracraurococcus lichenis TaxID=3064888 RepID=A0ABT9DXC6_9PROT|nr:response regulator [Paracraurococcus sp. LOR1-02]MDO9708552.1 response regulator [Paracraurococcus sp. LOR1-02]
MTARAAPRRLLLGGLRGPTGSEREMSFNRLLFALAFAAYLPAAGGDLLRQGMPILLAWGLCALGIFAHIRLTRGPSMLRRAFALLLDIGCLSWFLHLGGDLAAPFFPVYLWVALGNGFRFGPRWLLAGMSAFVVGFGAVVLTTPYWQGLPHLAIGLLVGPVILALYAGTLIRKLSQARLAAEQASEAKTRFLAGVSHELRTPLNAIIGMGGLLRDTPLDAEQQEMARTIDGAARGLLGQINGLLDISRIEAGATVMRSESVDLPGLLAEIRGLLLAQAREKGLALRLHATPRTPARVMSDPAALRDILLNLGGNAVKFTASGSVTIAVDAEPGEGEALLLRLEVSDTGIGIDAAAQARIFERFSQADETIAGRFGGTGLGLALCKGLSGLLGGSIGVASRPGEGSSFHVTVPARRDPAPPAPGGAELRALLLTTAMERAAPVAAGLAELGIAAVPRLVPEETFAAVWGAGAGAPPEHLLAFAGPAGLPAPEDVAAALRGAGPAAELPVFALGGAPPRGLPEPGARRRIAAWLPGAPGPADWAMPLALARAMLPRPAAPAPRAPQVAPMRVLVADDNRVNRLVVQKILEREGHSVTLVADGEEALDALEAGHFDLALMDLNMPGTDGATATRLYRFAALGRPHLPILGLTADATPEAAERCRAAGMDGCLVKPIEPAQLAAAVAAHAPQRAEAAPLPPAVTPIGSHPRYRPAAPPALDPTVRAELVALGGARFAQDLTADFLADAREVLRTLETAAAQGDAARFRAAAHALRSSAANIGARGVFALSSAAEAMPAGEVPVAGRKQAALLAEELERVCAAGRDAADGAA